MALDDKSEERLVWAFAGLTVLAMLAWLFGFLIWDSGQIAGLVAHGRFPASTPGDVPGVLIKVWSTLADPAQAWPAKARAGVGPASLLYVLFAVQLVVVIGIILLVIRMVLRFRRRRKSRRLRLGFASPGEVERLLSASAVQKKAPSVRPSMPKARAGDVGFAIGKDIRSNKQLYGSVEDVFLIVAPPRQGKDVHFCIPYTIDAPGPVLMTSTRADAFGATVSMREQVGHVWVFDPNNMTSWPNRLRWSPVRGCEEPLRALSRASAFVAGAGVGEGVTNASYWTGVATSILRCYLHAAALANRTMADVVRWSTQPSNPEPANILRWGEQQGIAAPGWAGELEQAASADSESRGNMWNGVRRALDCFADPSVLASCSPGPEESFDVQAFLNGRNTLYVLGKEKKAGSVAPLVTALMEDIFDQARAIATRQPNSRLDPPLTVELNEAAHIAPMPNLPGYMGDSGGFSIALHVYLQSLAQARSRWSDDEAAVMWDTAAVRVVMGGSGHVNDLDDISRLIGEVEEKQKTRTRGNDGRSVSVSQQPRRVLTIDELRTLEFGRAVVVARSARPVEIQLTPWWKRSDAEAIKAGQKRVSAMLAEPDRPTVLLPAAKPKPALPAAGLRPEPKKPAGLDAGGYRPALGGIPAYGGPPAEEPQLPSWTEVPPIPEPEVPIHERETTRLPYGQTAAQPADPPAKPAAAGPAPQQSAPPYAGIDSTTEWRMPRPASAPPSVAEPAPPYEPRPVSAAPQQASSPPYAQPVSATPAYEPVEPPPAVPPPAVQPVVQPYAQPVSAAPARAVQPPPAAQPVVPPYGQPDAQPVSAAPSYGSVEPPVAQPVAPSYAQPVSAAPAPAVQPPPAAQPVVPPYGQPDAQPVSAAPSYGSVEPPVAQPYAQPVSAAPAPAVQLPVSQAPVSQAPLSQPSVAEPPAPTVPPVVQPVAEPVARQVPPVVQPPVAQPLTARPPVAQPPVVQPPVAQPAPPVVQPAPPVATPAPPVNQPPVVPPEAHEPAAPPPGQPAPLFTPVIPVDPAAAPPEATTAYMPRSPELAAPQWGPAASQQEEPAAEPVAAPAEPQPQPTASPSAATRPIPRPVSAPSAAQPASAPPAQQYAQPYPPEPQAQPAAAQFPASAPPYVGQPVVGRPAVPPPVQPAPSPEPAPAYPATPSRPAAAYAPVAEPPAPAQPATQPSSAPPFGPPASLPPYGRPAVRAAGQPATPYEPREGGSGVAPGWGPPAANRPPSRDDHADQPQAAAPEPAAETYEWPAEATPPAHWGEPPTLPGWEPEPQPQAHPQQPSSLPSRVVATPSRPVSPPPSNAPTADWGAQPSQLPSRVQRGPALQHPPAGYPGESAVPAPPVRVDPQPAAPYRVEPAQPAPYRVEPAGEPAPYQVVPAEEPKPYRVEPAAPRPPYRVDPEN